MDFKALDEKVHAVHSGWFKPNMRGNRFRVHYDVYTDYVLTNEEAETLVDKVKSSPNLVLYPINTAFGLSVGYAVARVVGPGISRVVFRCTERQFPEGYRWDRLSEVFLSRKNLAMMCLGGLGRIEDRSAYEY